MAHMDEQKPGQRPEAADDDFQVLDIEEVGPSRFRIRTFSRQYGERVREMTRIPRPSWWSGANAGHEQVASIAFQ